MPILFTIYEERGFFLSTWSGVISDDDLLTSYKTLFGDEKYKPGFHEIADTRNADITGVTSDGFRKLFQMVESHLTGKCEGFKTAIIAPEAYIYGMSRMYEMLSEGMSNTVSETVMVFKDPAEAIKWIGVEDFSLE